VDVRPQRSTPAYSGAQRVRARPGPDRDDDLVDEIHIDLPCIEQTLDEGKEATLQWTRDDWHHHFVEDVISEMEWWYAFTPSPPPPPPQSQKKIGRNEPCPCGSGEKYKYCCGKRR
jgi:hypothetical protein